MSPEARFVIACTREAVSCPEQVVRSAADRVQDWTRVVRLAADQRVSALVLRAVTASGIAVPDTARHALVADSRTSLMKTMLLDRVLVTLARDLKVRDVPVIVLKGPALVRTLYESAALRPYGDIDVLVQGEHERDAVVCLAEQGFSEVFADEDPARRHPSHHDDEVDFHRLFWSDTAQALVELHLDPLQMGLRPRCEDGRWTRAIPVSGMPDVSMFCAEDQLVHLSVHVHKHGFERLIWLKDIDLLIRQWGDGLDWELVASIAHTEGVTASVWLTLKLARLMLRTPVRHDVLARLQPSFVMRLLYQRAWPVGTLAELQGEMHRRAVQLVTIDSWRGVIPNLVFMGRRRERARAALRLLIG